MAKTAIFNMRMDPEVKREAEELFAEFGLNLTDAINIFLYQSIREQGLPFEMKRRQRAVEEKTTE